MFLTRAREAEAALGAARAQASELRAALDEHRGPWFEAVAAGVEERVRGAMARADALEAELAEERGARGAAEKVGGRAPGQAPGGQSFLAGGCTAPPACKPGGDCCSCRRCGRLRRARGKLALLASGLQDWAAQRAELEGLLSEARAAAAAAQSEAAAARSAEAVAREDADAAGVREAAARGAAEERAAELRVAQDTLRAMREEVNERWVRAARRAAAHGQRSVCAQAALRGVREQLRWRVRHA